MKEYLQSAAVTAGALAQAIITAVFICDENDRHRCCWPDRNSWRRDKEETDKWSDYWCSSAKTDRGHSDSRTARQQTTSSKWRSATGAK